MSKLGYDETNISKIITDLGRCENYNKYFTKEISELNETINEQKIIIARLNNDLDISRYREQYFSRRLEMTAKLTQRGLSSNEYNKIIDSIYELDTIYQQQLLRKFPANSLNNRDNNNQQARKDFFEDNARKKLNKQHKQELLDKIGIIKKWTCNICLEPLLPYKEGNDKSVTLPCGHSYHEICVRRMKNNLCPECRRPFTYRDLTDFIEPTDFSVKKVGGRNKLTRKSNIFKKNIKKHNKTFKSSMV
jgi:hypothetical protein